MKTLIGIIIVLTSLVIQAQNSMHVLYTECIRTQTVTIPIEVLNQDEFVAFQFDLIFPEDVEFLSAKLTDRKVDHDLSAVAVGNNRARFVAYSLNNFVFTGVEGVVLNVDVEVHAQAGEYDILLEDVILASLDAQNIIDDVYHGILLVKEPTFSIKGISNNDLLGRVEGSGIYKQGYPVRLLAVSYRSTEFVKWTTYENKPISKNKNLIFKAEADEVYIAHFKKKDNLGWIDRLRHWWRTRK